MFASAQGATSTDLSHLASRIRSRRGRRRQLVPIVVATLYEAIESGNLQAGAKLANEVRLAEQLDISRPTLRQAIGVLVHDGVLDMKRGVGTFVSDRRAPIRSTVEQMRSATQLIKASGRVPGVRDCEIADSICTDSIARPLGIDSGDGIVTITRTRLADDEPLMACFEYLPGLQFGTAQNFSGFDGVSLYRYLETNFGIVIDRCETSIAAVSALPPVAKRLLVKTVEPVLELTQTHFRNNQVVFLSRNYHNTRLIKFSTHRVVLPEQLNE